VEKVALAVRTGTASAPRYVKEKLASQASKAVIETDGFLVSLWPFDPEVDVNHSERSARWLSSTTSPATKNPERIA